MHLVLFKSNMWAGKQNFLTDFFQEDRQDCAHYGMPGEFMINDHTYYYSCYRLLQCGTL